MTAQMTVADLAATSLTAIPILEQHGLDSCCGGKQSFEAACFAKGFTPEAILSEVDEAEAADLRLADRPAR